MRALLVVASIFLLAPNSVHADPFRLGSQGLLVPAAPCLMARHLAW